MGGCVAERLLPEYVLFEVNEMERALDVVPLALECPSRVARTLQGSAMRERIATFVEVLEVRLICLKDGLDQLRAAQLSLCAEPCRVMSVSASRASLDNSQDPRPLNRSMRGRMGD
jgi:hypothetical protein